MKNEKNLTPIEDLITEDFGAIGTPGREQFDMECDAFIIGEQLKDERLRAGLTQEQLADMAGVHRTYIGMIERAEKNITLCNIERIAKALEVNIKDLF